MEDIYRKIPLDKIPWNFDSPPSALIDLFKRGKVTPCKTIDLGCGVGNYALYFTTLGFDVTGIDISSSAVNYAKENANKRAINCRFLVADILGDLNEVKDTFDFAYDWEVLHHIFPVNRKKYIKNVFRILNPRAKYLSVCFGEKDPYFGGSGKFRDTPLGTTLYFSSEYELEKLFEPYFNILELKTIEIRGQSVAHSVNFAFMEKK